MNNSLSLTPKKNKKGNRLFTPKDIKNLQIIYHLIKERGKYEKIVLKTREFGKETKPWEKREKETDKKLLSI